MNVTVNVQTSWNCMCVCVCVCVTGQQSVSYLLQPFAVFLCFLLRGLFVIDSPLLCGEEQSAMKILMLLVWEIKCSSTDLLLFRRFSRALRQGGGGKRTNKQAVSCLCSHLVFIWESQWFTCIHMSDAPQTWAPHACVSRSESSSPAEQSKERTKCISNTFL